MTSFFHNFSKGGRWFGWTINIPIVSQDWWIVKNYSCGWGRIWKEKKKPTIVWSLPLTWKIKYKIGWHSCLLHQEFEAISKFDKDKEVGRPLYDR